MKKFISNSSLLTISQASKLLSVHPDTLRRWERQKKLKSVRVGTRRDRRYRNEDLLVLVDEPLNEKDTKINSQEKSNKKEILTAIAKADWIFFDVGYTLMTLFPSRGDVYADIAYDYGYNLNPKIIEANFDQLGEEWDKQKIRTQPLTRASSKTVSKHYAQFNSEVLIRSGIPRQDKSISLTIGKRIFNEVFSNNSLWRIFNEVKDFLNLLKKNNKKLAVIENWDKRLPGFMKSWSWDLDKYFDFIISGGELKLRKPDPQIFQIALDKAKTKPQKTVYIGNRYTEDVLGAKELGITPILFDRERNYKNNDCLKFFKYKELLS